MAKSKLVVFFALILVFSVPVGLAYADGHGSGSGTAVISDGNALGDVLTVTLEGVSQPDEGTSLVAWLLSDDGETQTNVGALDVDANGGVSLRYVSDMGDNLLAMYGQFVVTMESDSAADAASDPVLIGYLAGDGNLAAARALLVESEDDEEAGSLTKLRGQLADAHASAGAARTAGTLDDMKAAAQMVIDAIDHEDNGVLALAQHASETAAAAGAQEVAAAARNVHDWSSSARAGASSAMDSDDLTNARAILSTVEGQLNSSLNGVGSQGGAEQAYMAAQGLATFHVRVPDPLPVSVVVGDPALPVMAQLATAAALVLLIAGSALVIRGRRSRA